jgi:cell division transport system permease protein
MNEKVDSALVTPAQELVTKRDMPLIPGDTVAGRALVVVIAIMTFLACLAAGSAVLVARASQSWRSDVLRDVTIQVKPKPNDNADNVVAKAASIAAKAPGVDQVHAYSADESRKLLAPWLGDTFDLALLPVPRIIVVHMQARAENELAGLRQALSQTVPEADLDDHRIWAARIGMMANAVVGVAVGVFVLVIVAMATAIGFATRGAVAGNREIVEVLHFIGASDSFIAKQFQIHFQRLGLRGALVGAAAAIAFFLSGSTLSWIWANSVGGAEIGAFFGSFALGLPGYLELGLVGAAVTVLTGFLSRAIVLRHLRALR